MRDNQILIAEPDNTVRLVIPPRPDLTGDPNHQCAYIYWDGDYLTTYCTCGVQTTVAAQRNVVFDPSRWRCSSQPVEKVDWPTD